MSKHAIDDDVKGDFWKKVRYGAAAAVTLGSGIYAVTSVLKRQGLSNIVDEFKTAMQTTPRVIEDTTSNSTMQPDDETRAALSMKLKFAMEHQDMQRVQEISRQLDMLEAYVPKSATTQAGVKMMMSQVPATQMQHTSPQAATHQMTMAQTQMPPQAATHPMPMSPTQMQMPLHAATHPMTMQTSA